MADRTRELSALLSSAAIVFVGSIVAATATLVERVIVGRLLSPTAYGEVGIGLALFTFTVTVALAGFTQGVARFIPRFDATEDRRGVWLSGVVVTGGLGVIVATGLFALADPITAVLFETEESVWLVRWLALSIPFVVAFRIAVAAVRGYENTIYYAVTHDIIDPLLRIGLIALALFAGANLVAVGVAYFMAAIVTCVVAHLLLSRLLSLRGPYRTHVRDMLTFSAPLVVSTIVGILLTRTDTLMLGYFRTSREVGLYEAAYPLATGLLVVLSAFGFLYLPIASRLDADGDRDVVDDIYATTTKWVYLVTFPGFFVFVLFPEDILRIFFGTAYIEAAVVLPILAVGFFLSAAAGRDRETLSALGSTNWIMIGNALGLGLNVALNLVLIPLFGIVGAGIASATSFFLLHGVICGVLWYEFDITPLSTPATRTYVSLPVVLLPIGYLVSNWIGLTMVTLLPALVATGLTCLVVVYLVGGMESDDRVVLEFFEDTVGMEVPYVRTVLPDG